MSINVGDGIVKLIADPSGVDRELAQMGRKGSRAGKQVAAGLKPVSGSLANIKKLALGVGAVFGAWQVIRVLKDAAKAALDFGKEFANVATLIDTKTPVGVKQLKILKQQILALRPELGSATDLTKGLYQALSAGAEPAEAVRLVGEAALFAKAGLTDTLTAVDVITTAINAYGLSAADAASVSSTLFKTIELGKITGQELAASLGRVIPTAAALNVSLPELNAALATMTKSGLSTAEAVTSLRAILKTLTSPEAIKRFEKLGISQAEMRDIITKDGLNAALQELGKRLKGSTAATTDLFRETEAQVGVFTLLGAGAEEYKQNVVKLTKAQKDATATAIAAEKQFAALSSRLETISVTMQKEFTVAFENMIPVFKVVLTSFGDTGTSGKILSSVLAGLGLGFTLIVGAIQGVVLAIQFLLLGFSEIVRLGAVLAQKIPFLGDTVFGDLAKQVEQVAEGFSVQLDGAMKGSIASLGQLVDAWRPANEIMAQAEQQTEKTAKAIDKITEAAGRVAPSFDLAAAGIARFRGEHKRLLEQFEEARFKQSLEELNQGLADLTLNLELASEGIGVFVEPTEEQLEAMRARLEETGISFTDLGQQATDAFNQIAGSVQGSGGVMLRVLGLIVGQIFRNIVANQALAASTVATEAAKKGATIKAVKDIALVKSIFEFAEGFAALGRFDFFSAAKHFAAAAFFGAVGALQIAAVAGAFGGRGGGEGTAGAGAEGAAPVRGQVAGDTSGGGTLEVERRLQGGGIITRPTLALLGEQAPRIPEAVIPLRRNRAGGIELDEGDGEPVTPIQIFIEGVIADDTLFDFIEKLSNAVKHSDVALQASDSFNVTQR